MTVVRRRIIEHYVPGRRLGRHVRHDSRSRDYPAELAPEIVSVLHPSAGGMPLDQGDVCSCTAEALSGALNLQPDYREPPGLRTQAQAYLLYDQEVALEGEPPGSDPGGDGLTVCQAAKNAGLITSYTHTFSAGDALKALVIRPVICGVNWYDSMDSPDANGLVTITPAAAVRGGHEILAFGIDAQNELIWFWNSWGRSFGLGGTFSMSFATCERLLSEDGDVTVPVI